MVSFTQQYLCDGCGAVFENDDPDVFVIGGQLVHTDETSTQWCGPLIPVGDKPDPDDYLYREMVGK